MFLPCMRSRPDVEDTVLLKGERGCQESFLLFQDGISHASPQRKLDYAFVRCLSIVT